MEVLGLRVWMLRLFMVLKGGRDPETLTLISSIASLGCEDKGCGGGGLQVKGLRAPPVYLGSLNLGDFMAYSEV